MRLVAKVDPGSERTSMAPETVVIMVEVKSRVMLRPSHECGDVNIVKVHMVLTTLGLFEYLNYKVP